MKRSVDSLPSSPSKILVKKVLSVSYRKRPAPLVGQARFRDVVAVLDKYTIRSFTHLLPKNTYLQTHYACHSLRRTS